jgi:hypothetical protein
MASICGSRLIALAAIIMAALCFFAAEANAQAPKKPLKPTELVVKQGEDIVAKGLLLTPDGWKQSAKLWSSASPYPQNGEIVVESFSAMIVEDWVKDKRAQVSTKWDDFYGTIDSSLRYKPGLPNHESTMMGQSITLVCIDSKKNDNDRDQSNAANEGCAGEWKLEGPLLNRAANIPMAIKYITVMRDKSTDPVVRKNADRTINTLRRLSPACGTASAC